MKIQAELWMQDALSGLELTTEQRRHVVAWMMATGSHTAAEMAVIFKVHERTIITDKSKIRELMAESIKAEDVGLILADIRLSFENAIRRVEKALKKAKPGTGTYLDYVRAIPDLQLQYMKAYQDLGYYPKNLGTIQVDKFEFKATVGLNAGNEQRPVKMFGSEPPTISGEVVETKALTDGKDSSSKTSGSTPEDVGHSKESHDQGSNAPAPASTQLPAVQADTCVGSPIPSAGEPS